MTERSTAVDEYLATLGDDQRSALEGLREIISEAAPGADECISYQMPAFCLDGKALVAYGAGKKHCALYPLSPAVLAALQGELAGFETSKGTIRFQPDKPLPKALVYKLVRARIAENESRR